MDFKLKLVPLGLGASFSPPLDNYSALGEIDFGNSKGVLKIDAKTKLEITFDATTTVLNAAHVDSKLDVDTNLTVKHKSFAGISKLDIAAGKKLTFEVADDVTTTANSVITFGDAASAVIFNIDNSVNNKTITLGADISGGAAINGTIEFISGGAGKDLTIAAGGARSIGTDNGVNRIATLKIGGAGNVIFDGNTTVRAKGIVQNNTGTTTYTTEVDSGANSTMRFDAVGTVKFLEGIKNAEIDFNNQGATIELSDGKTITGAVDNKAGAGDTGTLKFIGAGKVTDVIGANNTLKLIDAHGVGKVELVKAVKATTLRIGNLGTIVDAADVVTANVDFAAAGEYQANKIGANAIVGDVNFNGHNGTLNVEDTADINGAINNDQSAVITLADKVAVAFDADNALDGNAAYLAINVVGVVQAAIDAALVANVPGASASDVLTAAIAAINGNNFVVAEALKVGGGTIAKDAVVVFGNKTFGKVIFAGDSKVTGPLGAGKPLELVHVAGANLKTVVFDSALKSVELKLDGGANAQIDEDSVIDTLTLGNVTSEVKIKDAKVLEFTGNADVTLQLNTGKITFDGNDSTLKFNAADGNHRTVDIAGADLDSGGAGKGKIILRSDGNDGGATKSILTIQGGNKLGNASTFQFIQVEGDAITEIKTPIKTVLLDIKQNATLITTDASASLATNTVIGEAGGAATLVYAGDDVNMLLNNTLATNTKFSHADSLLRLQDVAAKDRTFTLQDDLNPGGVKSGIIELHSNGAGSKVTLTAVGGGKAIGVGNNLKELRATGDKGISTVAALVDITNVDKLSVAKGATLDVRTHTAGAIAAISIGEAGGGGKLILDTNAQANVDLLDVGKAITFEHADSVLRLTNVGGADGAFKLKNNLAPGGANDMQGSLEVHSNGTNKLGITFAGGNTIGTSKAVRLKGFTVSGNKEASIRPAIYAKTINLNSTAKVIFLDGIDTGVVGGVDEANASKIFFGAASTVEFKGNVTTQLLNINDKAANITVVTNDTLSVGSIKNGANATLTFVDNGQLAVTGVPGSGDKVVVLGALKVAEAGKTELGAGQYTVTKVELTKAAGSLELADGFNLTGAINNGEGNAADVTFLGDGIVTDVMGSIGANKVGAVTVAGNSTLQLGGTVHATSIDGNAANAQNLNFINAGDIEVHGTVGNANPFTNIKFTTAKKVDFKNALTNPTTLEFSADAEVITAGFDLGATKITGDTDGKLIVDADQTITGAISNFGTLHVTNDKIVTLNTAKFDAKLTTHANNNGTVNLNDAALVVSDIGADGTGFKAVNITKNATAAKIFATTIDVSAASTLTAGTGSTNDFHINDTSKAIIGAMTIGNELKFFGADSEASFSTAGRDLNFSILGNAVGQGVLNLTNGETISQDIGTTRLKEVNIDSSPVTVSANISAETINVKDTITLTKDATFTGASNFTGATIDLGDKDLSLKGDVTFTGESEIKTTLKPSTEVGNFVIGTGSKVTLAGANKLKITVDDTKTLPIDGRTIVLIKKEGNADLSKLDVSKITVDSGAGSRFSSWEDRITDQGLVLTQESLTEDVIAAATDTSASSEFLDSLGNPEEGTRAYAFAVQLGTMTDENIDDSYQRLTNTTSNEVSAVEFNNLSEVTSAVSNRIAEVAAPIFALPQASPTTSSVPTSTPSAAPSTGGGNTGGGNITAPSGGTNSPDGNLDNKNQSGTDVSAENDYISGIAAGDDHDRYGAWVAPFYSQAKQKRRGTTSGFKAESYGGTFGFDTKANDSTTLGAAFSAMNTNIKHKDFKAGDKTTVNAFLVSIYGAHQFATNCFAQGVFSIGSSNVNNKETRRLSNTTVGTAKAKYNSMTFSTELMAGYNHALANQFVITPLVGVGYSRINGGSYKESGTADAQLLEVTKRASQKLDLIAGARLTARPFVINDVMLTPELHAFVRHDVIGKAAKVDAKLEGAANASEKPKLQKTFYSVGTSLNASYSMMDYGASVDAQFANKYVGVQGSLKMRVNF